MLKPMMRSVAPGLLVAVLMVLAGCRTTRHVPDGQYLLDHVKINIIDTVNERKVKSTELVNYLRQQPNHRVLGSLKLQLMTYDLSGTDSTKWYNKWLWRLGQPPVIHDAAMTSKSAEQLRLALVNRGYMGASVAVDSVMRPDKKKADIMFNVVPGRPHYISSFDYSIPDTAIARLVFSDTVRTMIAPGNLFDRNVLDAERARITDLMHNNGYYAFTKECITFQVDTAAEEMDVNLTLTVRPPKVKGQALDSISPSQLIHHRYVIRKVTFITDYQPGKSVDECLRAAVDSVDYRGVTVLYGHDRYIDPKTLWSNCFIEAGRLYSATTFDRTYEALGRLGILKSVNIMLTPITKVGDDQWLDAYILLSRGKKQGVTLELEGTNSEGDLGFGVGLTYQHRNLAHGGELLTAKLRTSYESLSGNVDGLINDRYTEYAAEVGVTFPEFKAPFLSRSYKRRVRASSELALSFNYQERPEYTRIVAGAGWKYKWKNRQNTTRRIFDLIDINYVYLPNSTLGFLDEIAPTNPLLRYSYEDHFIMRMGFTIYHTNKYMPAKGMVQNARFQPRIYTLRASVESAGNLLYAMSNLVHQRKKDGVYKLFGIQYAQYVKGEIDYMIARNFTPRTTLALHAGFGIGVPYGNSSMMPFEKRFYAGGANGVRGWGVRTLGPGRYDSRNSVSDFINQCGDIRIDLNAEYRAKLFWVLEGALFIDAGNIWTIRNYENQPNGMFRFKSFYKELAWAYGLGLRLDFEYFLLRFDLGMKAYNPAVGQQPWPLTHPNWKRDAAFHFSVGYPF